MTAPLDAAPTDALNAAVPSPPEPPVDPSVVAESAAGVASARRWVTGSLWAAAGIYVASIAFALLSEPPTRIGSGDWLLPVGAIGFAVVFGLWFVINIETPDVASAGTFRTQIRRLRLCVPIFVMLVAAPIFAWPHLRRLGLLPSGDVPEFGFVVYMVVAIHSLGALLRTTFGTRDFFDYVTTYPRSVEPSRRRAEASFSSHLVLSRLHAIGRFRMFAISAIAAIAMTPAPWLVGRMVDDPYARVERPDWLQGWGQIWIAAAGLGFSIATLTALAGRGGRLVAALRSLATLVGVMTLLGATGLLFYERPSVDPVGAWLGALQVAAMAAALLWSGAALYAAEIRMAANAPAAAATAGSPNAPSRAFPPSRPTQTPEP